jgi:predicted ribosome quality control (RQC) complex YloA/Tae2 family protein
MEKLKENVTKLEWRVDSHDAEISELKSASTDLKITLDAITKNLQQIKYIAIGGGIFLFADQVGLTAVLRLL